MDDQMQLFDTSEKQSSNNTGKAKRKWENGFQRWSDRHSADGGSSFGCCGFGSMCDYCDDNTYGRPCVRSLNAMIREKRLKIDYEKTGYEEVWGGFLAMAEYISDAEVLQRALDTYGSALQIVVMMEEMSELQKELCKYLRGKYSPANIAEEIADVEIMLEQMKMLFCCTDDVRNERRRKVERLKERLDNG